MLEDIEEDQTFSSDIYIPIPPDTHVPFYKRKYFIYPAGVLFVLCLFVLILIRFR